MNRILVALDASDSASAVLAYASALARRTGGRLVLFRAVIVPADFPMQAYTVTPSQLTPLLLESARTSLTTLAATAPEGMVEKVEIDVGVPWRMICDAARDLSADLIVVGSHGYGGVDRLLGTTAARVVNHAGCPVLVVRNPEQHPI